MLQSEFCEYQLLGVNVILLTREPGMGTGQGSVPPCDAECKHGDLSVVAGPDLPGLGPGPVPAGPQLRPVLPRLLRPSTQPPASPLGRGTGIYTSCQVEDTLCIFVRAVNGT